jgi:hypothetical protein
MRRIFRMIGAMLAIAAVLAITSAAPASALKSRLFPVRRIGPWGL